MDDYLENRKYIFVSIVILISIIFISKLFAIQVMDSTYKLSAENNVFRHVPQYPARGLIFDRNGELLVYNKPAYDLIAIPKNLGEFDTTDLCNILHVKKEILIDKIDEAWRFSKHKPSVIVSQINSMDYAILQEKMYKFDGFYIQVRSTRAYLQPIAAHLLGYTGEVDSYVIENNPYYSMGDYIGISGIEKSYEKELRGKKGINIFLVDVHNRIKGNYKNGKLDSAAVVGANLTITLDYELQAFAEQLMVNKKGGIVAIEPATGEILVLSSSPTYDPNILTKNRSRNFAALKNNRNKPLFNRALRSTNPPGSTFKMVNALIGLEEGVITESSVFVSNYGYRVGNHIVKDHIGGAINFSTSIQHSSNAYYCHVFQRIIDDKKFPEVSFAYDNWRKHVQSFGLGIKLEVDLLGEKKGIIYQSDHYNKFYGKNRWKSGTLISMAIGQGELGFTPLQIANMTATIANKGYYITPHIIRKISGQSSIDEKYKTKHYTQINPKYYDPVIDAMELVVRSGTATSAFLPNIAICGKTGTAQNPHGKDHSIFVAFAPKDNPKIAVAVYVENAGYGSTWAAPIASLLIERYLTDTISRPFVEQRMINADLINSN